VEGISQVRAQYRLRFGRFLAFITSGDKSEIVPRNLSERRFRSYWERTDKAESNERIRFRAVQTMLSEETVVRATRRDGLGKRILAEFADGKWHDISVIAKRVEETPESLKQMFADFGKKNNAYSVALCEKKQVGTKFQYRIMRAGRRIDIDVLMQDLGPILDGLKAEGRKNAATASPPTVAHLAHQLEQLLEKLAK
jgi:hypothetical protein